MRFASRIQEQLDRWRRSKTRHRAVQEFRRSLALIVDPDALVASVAARLKEIFDPDRLVILELDPKTRSFEVSFGSGLRTGLLDEILLPVQGHLVRWFQVNNSCLLPALQPGVMSYLHAEERRVLEQLGVEIAAPLLVRSQPVGLLFLGWDRGSRARREADLVLHLAEQAGLAFQNAFLYREQHESLDRLHRADRLSALGQLAAGVAHEVRNPLTAIRSTMQYLGSGFAQEDPKREMVVELIDEVDRIESTISNLLSLTRGQDLVVSRVDLVELLEQTVHLMTIQARKQGILFEERYAMRPLYLKADSQQLKQVFLNVFLNALQAMGDGGRILVSAGVNRDHQPPWAVVRIADEGTGMPENLRHRVFDPFFTTKKEGTGLGLAICKNLVERHHGLMELSDREEGGTVTSILLPMPDEAKDTEVQP